MVGLGAQVRVLRGLLELYHARLPGDVKRGIVDMLDEAEALKAVLKRELDPVLRRLGDKVLENG
ncbi:hypothetical protein ASQ66_gp06 [Aeropyrum pernix spindle-shaped virus 1]|uniref:hypothetical protein n=1 Tax=Aeropyrum pernix spindle-shaped virus 1 TaxID=1032473 RepID=UPI00022A29BB|nr:hypothetical protein [Aeropyrum pernix]YP_009177736.1 hypothetical protein ASQ66_gp06 [Aeropyrum pernix spindle-shaped virus 1]CCD22094.1 TPA: hypothetical protein [Aeropyrum pernix spindle-shaped virus 1]